MNKATALAALAGAILSASPPPIAPSSTFWVNLDLVRKIVCTSEDGGGTSGTGSYIDRASVLTAYHVVAHGRCTIDNVPVETVYSDAELDVAVLKTPTISSERMPIKCGRPEVGREYFAIGYPLGATFTIQRYTATGDHERRGQFAGMAHYRGMTTPGQSGGPVVDQDGFVVGTLNAGSPLGSMLSRDLADTYLCRDEGTKP